MALISLSDLTWPQGHKTFSCLTDYEILFAHKSTIAGKIKIFLASNHPDVVFILLMNV